MTNNADSEEDAYRKALHKAEVELMKFQKHVVENELKILVISVDRRVQGEDHFANIAAVGPLDQPGEIELMSLILADADHCRILPRRC